MRASPLRTRCGGAFAPLPTHCAFQLGVPRARFGSGIRCRSTGFGAELPSPHRQGLPFRKSATGRARIRHVRAGLGRAVMLIPNAFNWLDSSKPEVAVWATIEKSYPPSCDTRSLFAAARLSWCGPPLAATHRPAPATKRKARTIRRCLLPISATDSCHENPIIRQSSGGMLSRSAL